MSRETVTGEHFAAYHAGPFAQLDEVDERGKLFLKEIIGLTGMEVSLNKMAPGQQSPFYHKHQQNEELYLFIHGEGQFQVDGEVMDVKEGSAIRVSPEGKRAIRNTSATEALHFIVIQVKENGLDAWSRGDGIRFEGEEILWP